MQHEGGCCHRNDCIPSSLGRALQDTLQEHAVGGGGGAFATGIYILLWEISYFKCGRSFLLNSQAPVRNQLVSKFGRFGVSPHRRSCFVSSMIRSAWPCSDQSGGIVLVPEGATTSAPALGTHCLVLFAAGPLSLPLADLEAETDTEIDAPDELSLEIAGDEEEA